MPTIERRNEEEGGVLDLVGFFRNGNRLQVAFIMFVVVMGLLAAYNQIVSAFNNSNVATHEYVANAVQAEDNKVETQLGELRNKGNDSNVTHAAELATQTTMNSQNHDQLTAIENKVDGLSTQMGDVSNRLGKVETRLDDIAPRQKRFNP